MWRCGDVERKCASVRLYALSLMLYASSFTLRLFESSIVNTWAASNKKRGSVSNLKRMFS
jgi:hypothetical protein